MCMHVNVYEFKNLKNSFVMINFYLITHFSFSAKMINLLKSGFENCISLYSARRKGSPFLEKEIYTIIPGRKLYLIELDY